MEPIVVIYKPDFVTGSLAETEFDKGITDSGIKDAYRTITFKTSEEARIEIHLADVCKEYTDSDNKERERIKLELINGRLERDIATMKIKNQILLFTLAGLIVGLICSIL